jgi:hypothetical protein
MQSPRYSRMRASMAVLVPVFFSKKNETVLRYGTFYTFHLGTTAKALFCGHVMSPHFGFGFGF